MFSPLLFVSTNIRCQGLTSRRRIGQLLNHVFPDISEAIDHVGNTLTLTETCGLKYITLQQTFITWYLSCRRLVTFTETRLDVRNITRTFCIVLPLFFLIEKTEEKVTNNERVATTFERFSFFFWQFFHNLVQIQSSQLSPLGFLE